MSRTNSEMARRAIVTKKEKYKDSRKGLGDSFLGLAEMFEEVCNDISALAFEGRKEDAKEEYELELDRCDQALNGKKKGATQRGMYVREMQAEIVAWCTEMEKTPKKQMLKTNPRPLKQDVEIYWADVKRRHELWIKDNRRVFGRGGARTTKGVNRKRSAVEGYDTGTTTTMAPATATKKVKHKGGGSTTFRNPHKTDVQSCNNPKCIGDMCYCTY